MDDLSANDLSQFLDRDVPAWIDTVRFAIEPMVGDYTHLLDAPMLAAFLAGGLAITAGARLALVGAILMLLGHALVQIGVLPDLPEWVAPVAVLLVMLGAAQGLLTLLLGEQTAGTVLATAVLGTILFIIWHGPAKVLRLLGLLMLRRKGH
ncbi:hypothetical protein [Roseovarius sp.]|uniref:hypothetical protein n=1 Tax=Roseovarius sp. TaxID=1486281 RepID=UPI00356A8528